MLFASSATKDGIIKLIEKFYYRNDIALIPIENSKKEIYDVFCGEKKTNCIVLKKSGRYRFELINN
jgi:hypothetical protein